MRPVVLDACVLIPPTLSDLMLRLAEAGAFDPQWSARILREVRDHLEDRGISPAGADSRVAAMRRAFPLAEVDGDESTLPTLDVHRKDRHVLATAIHSHSEAIITSNLRDFPEQALAHWGLRARHPDEFLLATVGEYPERAVRAVQRLQAHYRRPPVSMDEVLGRLERSQVPGLAAELRRQLPTFTE